MLNTTYALADMEDVEGFCSRVAHLFCNRTRTRLDAADFEDLVSFLIAECWRLSERYTPTTSRARFKSYAYGPLTYRCTDWTRKHLGRSKWQWSNGKVYERERPQVASLDRPIGDGADTLGSSLANGAGDGPADRDTSLSWFHGAGDRQRAADTALLRADCRRRARARAERRRADRG